MPPKKGGNKQRKAKKGSNDENDKFLPIREKGQCYGVATKMLGNRRLLARCEDEKERLCIIPGKFKGKRYWIEVGYLLLLNLRDYQDAKCDVIYIYSSNEFNKLKRMGELAKLISDKEEDDEKGIVFYDEEHKPEDNESNINNILEDSEESVDLEDL